MPKSALAAEVATGLHTKAKGVGGRQARGVPRLFSRATSYQVRDESAEIVRRDFLGPWDGEAEQFRPRGDGSA